RILCIGYTDEDDRGRFESDTVGQVGNLSRDLAVGQVGNLSRGVIGWNEALEQFTLDEPAMLREFWSKLEGFSVRRDLIVGHNIFDFDLKFIYKRSVICGVRPSVDLSFARYRSQPIFDTMHEWEKWGYGSKISLDKLARILGLPSSKAGGMDGSLV